MSHNSEPSTRRIFPNATEQTIYDMSRMSGEITGRLFGSLILSDLALERTMQDANHDDLTNLYNRRGIDLIGNDLVNRQKPFVAIFYDLTNFKRANDLFGHDQGDILLATVADILRYKKRNTDVFARIGGDEFLGLIDASPKDEPENWHTPLERAQIVVDRTLELFDNHVERTGMGNLGLGISVGAVEFKPQTHRTFQDVISHADRKMMEHKRLQHQALGSYRPE